MILYRNSVDIVELTLYESDYRVSETVFVLLTEYFASFVDGWPNEEVKN